MLSKFRPDLKKPSHRYLVTGISVYLFELLVILVAEKLGASGILAVGLSFWLGFMVSFGLQKAFTFKDKRTHHRILVPQIIAYALLVLFNFGFTLLVTQLLVALVPAVVTRTVALGITTVWNFYLYRTRIFKTDDNLVY
ncbi:MAG TPA: GtrA family protein [Candidatus Saccharimonadales bacterium]